MKYICYQTILNLYSQGPVQFPSNNNNEEDLQNFPNPYESVSLKSQTNDKRRILVQDDDQYVNKLKFISKLNFE